MSSMPAVKITRAGIEVNEVPTDISALEDRMTDVEERVTVNEAKNDAQDELIHNNAGDIQVVTGKASENATNLLTDVNRLDGLIVSLQALSSQNEGEIDGIDDLIVTLQSSTASNNTKIAMANSKYNDLLAMNPDSTNIQTLQAAVNALSVFSDGNISVTTLATKAQVDTKQNRVTSISQGFKDFIVNTINAGVGDLHTTRKPYGEWAIINGQDAAGEDATPYAWTDQFYGSFPGDARQSYNMKAFVQKGDETFWHGKGPKNPHNTSNVTADDKMVLPISPLSALMYAKLFDNCIVQPNVSLTDLYPGYSNVNALVVERELTPIEVDWMTQKLAGVEGGAPDEVAYGEHADRLPIKLKPGQKLKKIRTFEYKDDVDQFMPRSVYREKKFTERNGRSPSNVRLVYKYDEEKLDMVEADDKWVLLRPASDLYLAECISHSTGFWNYTSDVYDISYQVRSHYEMEALKPLLLEKKAELIATSADYTTYEGTVFKASKDLDLGVSTADTIAGLIADTTNGIENTDAAVTYLLGTVYEAINQYLLFNGAFANTDPNTTYEMPVFSAGFENARKYLNNELTSIGYPSPLPNFPIISGTVEEHAAANNITDAVVAARSYLAAQLRAPLDAKIAELRAANALEYKPQFALQMPTTMPVDSSLTIQGLIDTAGNGINDQNTAVERILGTALEGMYISLNFNDAYDVPATETAVGTANVANFSSAFDAAVTFYQNAADWSFPDLHYPDFPTPTETVDQAVARLGLDAAAPASYITAARSVLAGLRPAVDALVQNRIVNPPPTITDAEAAQEALAYYTDFTSPARVIKWSLDHQLGETATLSASVKLQRYIERFQHKDLILGQDHGVLQYDYSDYVAGALMEKAYNKYHGRDLTVNSSGLASLPTGDAAYLDMYQMIEVEVLPALGLSHIRLGEYDSIDDIIQTSTLGVNWPQFREKWAPNVDYGYRYLIHNEPAYWESPSVGARYTFGHQLSIIYCTMAEFAKILRVVARGGLLENNIRFLNAEVVERLLHPIMLDSDIDATVHLRGGDTDDCFGARWRSMTPLGGTARGPGIETINFRRLELLTRFVHDNDRFPFDIHNGEIQNIAINRPPSRCILIQNNPDSLNTIYFFPDLDMTVMINVDDGTIATFKEFGAFGLETSNEVRATLAGTPYVGSSAALRQDYPRVVGGENEDLSGVAHLRTNP